MWNKWIRFYSFIFANITTHNPGDFFCVLAIVVADSPVPTVGNIILATPTLHVVEPIRQIVNNRKVRSNKQGRLTNKQG